MSYSVVLATGASGMRCTSSMCLRPVADAGGGPLAEKFAVGCTAGRAVGPPRLSSAAMAKPDSCIGATPGMGLEHWLASASSSIGQYAISVESDGILLRSVDCRSFLPWFRRRRIPAASPSTVISCPARSQRGGQSEYSPAKRTHRSVIVAPLASVHVSPAPSTKDVAPGVCAVKSTAATAVPSMPLRSSKPYKYPSGEAKPRAPTSPTWSGAVLSKICVADVGPTAEPSCVHGPVNVGAV